MFILALIFNCANAVLQIGILFCFCQPVSPMHSGTKTTKKVYFDIFFFYFFEQKCKLMELFGSNFSNLGIFGRKNIIFRGFESAKVYILAIF